MVLACLFAVAAAAPQLEQEPVADAAPQLEQEPVAAAVFKLEQEPVDIVFDERSDSGDGNFKYNFEAENGIAMDVSGTPGAAGQSNMQGVFR